MTMDLFVALEDERIALGRHSMVLRGFVLDISPRLFAVLTGVLKKAPLRRMATPGGREMSVETSNCGTLGWVSDRRGYRYSTVDPISGVQWPDMPQEFHELASGAADAAGYKDFVPDACLINRYCAGARMSLHQDKNEHDMTAPIVSVSLGMPATFLFGGMMRSDRPARVALHHGDVAVWGGEDRLRFHGVMPLIDQPHSMTGSYRYNLTFRLAGRG